MFTSFGCETTKKFTVESITAALETFSEDDSFGMVLRAKGIVEGEDGEWIHFDYVPAEPNVNTASMPEPLPSPSVWTEWITPLLCRIGPAGVPAIRR